MNELQALRQFANDILDCWPGPDFELGGDSIEEAAVNNGMLKPVDVTERCGDGCACDTEGTFPTVCYRPTRLLLGDYPILTAGLTFEDGKHQLHISSNGFFDDLPLQERADLLVNVAEMLLDRADVLTGFNSREPLPC